jgi:hypothetical protein
LQLLANTLISKEEEKEREKNGWPHPVDKKEEEQGL